MARFALLTVCLFLPLSGVRGATLTVTHAGDSGAGSLRQAISDAGGAAGADIIDFAPALNGQMIHLTGGPLLIFDAGGLTIDASALSHGLILRASGVANDRAIISTGPLTLRRLSITGSTLSAGQGGAAIYSSGTLTMEDCSVYGNTAGFGAAFFNDGIATLVRCSFTGNTSEQGAAIYNRAGPLQLRNCTVAGNTATTGFSIYNDGTMELAHVTVAANLAPGGEGGTYNAAARSLTLNYSIIGQGNEGTSDLINAGTVTIASSNLAEKAISNVGAGSTGGPGSVTVLAPNLMALGDYGGATLALYPLPGSPAIDTAGGTTETEDQRGVARPVDGNFDGFFGSDLGAIEFDPLVVVTTADSGPGSLRSVIEVASNHAGPDTVRFCGGLAGKTIVLTSGEIFLIDFGGLTVDGTDLEPGVTVDGNNNGQIFMNFLASLTLRGLNLTRAYRTGDYGGAVHNDQGTLVVDRCAIFGNYGQFSGAGVRSYKGNTTIINSTIANNVGGSGAGVSNEGLSGSMSIIHCTITGNSLSGCGYGGGVWSILPLVLENSIVAGNSASCQPASSDIAMFYPVTISGTDIIQSLLDYYGTGTIGSGTILNTAPMLNPLGWNGGRSRTAYLQPTSPAIDGATGSTTTEDQRSAPRPEDGDGDLSAVEDIGALEVGPTCFPPTQPVDGLLLTKGPTDGDILFSITSSEGASTRTGFRLRRADALVDPLLIWPVLNGDVPDEDGGVAGTQWTETSGDLSPTGIWFFQATSVNTNCWAEGPF